MALFKYVPTAGSELTLEGVRIPATVGVTYNEDREVFHKYVPSILTRYVDGVETPVYIPTSLTGTMDSNGDIFGFVNKDGIVTQFKDLGGDVDPQTPEEIKDGLESLSGDDRLDASAIKDVVNQVQLQNVAGIPARNFGFIPGVGIDNTSAWEAYNTYLTTTSSRSQLPLIFEAGEYYFTKWVIPGATGSQDSSGRYIIPNPKIIGKGVGVTVFKPLPSTEKIFIGQGRGVIHNLELLDFSVEGIDSTNPEQSGIVFIAKRGPINNTGGIFYARYNIKVSRFNRRQWLSKGGDNPGPMPQQFWDFMSSEFYRKDGIHYNVFSLMGQHGQIRASGTMAASGSYLSSNNPLKNAGANIYIGQTIGQSASAVNSISSDIIQLPSGNANFYHSCQPVRIVPTDGTGVAPVGTSFGTTYYTILKSNTTIQLASSAINANAQTALTLGAYTSSIAIVPHWVESVNTTTGLITLSSDIPLTDADCIRFVGTNLPTGITAGLDYYWSWVSDNTGYIYYNATAATAISQALAGGTTGRVIPTTAGTLSNFGVKVGGTSAAASPIGVDLGLISSSGAEVGLLVDSSAGSRQCEIKLQGYFEQLHRGIEVRGTGNVNVYGIEYANCGMSGGAQRGSVFTVDGTSAVLQVSGTPLVSFSGGAQNLQSLVTKRLGGIFKVSGTGPILGFTPVMGTGTSDTTSQYYGSTAAQLAHPFTENGSVDSGNLDYFLLNGGSNSVATLNSRLTIGSKISIRIVTASTISHCDFTNSGNLYLGSKTIVRVRAGCVVSFKLSDSGDKWVLTDISEDIMNRTQTVSFATSATIDVDLGGVVNFGTLTGNTTITVNNGISGDSLTIFFAQDSTGSRTITWPSNFKVATSSVGGASTVACYQFKYNGTNWIQTSNTSWIS